MFSKHENKCPICGTKYQINQEKCTVCYWDLGIYLNYKKQSPEKLIKTAEKWARIAFSKIRQYRKERNELRKKMEESPNFTQELFEIKLRLSDIERKLENLSPEQPLSTNIKEELKQEIISEVKAEIREIIQESLKKLPINNISNQDNQFDNSSYTIETEFIENKENYPEKSPNLEKTPNIEINQYEQYILEQYYNNPEFLEQYAYKVNATKKTLEDIYLNKANQIVFQESHQSDYWIVELKNGGYCLLPDLNLKINTNLKAIKTIFELNNYQDNVSKNFRVLKTAKVMEINNQWQLTEKGVLQF
ncbi:hypothetical protein H6G11_17280 [Cyanobacterium aponinum FACHB-4101]|uniref:hypothetical protein n=1 Tax=Cyanobacterium aponinum TaxID=379064 RepID=UPI0016814B8A|nr:hypothetical protein [Cyanobacterium aponinum]MBD2396000.1 hypothetical protein [Cyanobacterium aponinum FACHB-4101]